MLQPHRLALRIGIFAAAITCAGNAAAASQRTFVATSGVDNPTCSLGSPCRTFGAAVTATVPGGEVIVLNSGGYGQVTITQSVSIISAPGVYAGISVSSGIGIVVTTASTDSVTLRGIAVNNVGSGTSGIRFTGDGRLQIEDVHVSGFSIEGLLFAPATAGDLIVERSSFAKCGWGIVVTPAFNATANALIDRVTTHHHANTGVQIGDLANVVVRGSTSTYNGFGVWSYGQTQGLSGTMTVESSDLSYNQSGAVAGGFAGNGVISISNSVVTQNDVGVSTQNTGVVLLAGSSVTRNNTGIAYSGTGVANSQGNNLISGNVTDGTAPTVVGSK